MHWRFCVISYLILVASVTIGTQIPKVYSQGLVAYPLQVAVNFDGRVTSATEWTDVDELELGIGTMEGAAYFGAKYDANYLYMLYDFVECTTLFKGNTTVNPNQVFIYMNPSNKATSTLDNSMYRIFVFAYSQTPRISRGTASGEWTDTTASTSSDVSARAQLSKSPHSGQNHLVVEMRIALTFGDIKSNMAGGIGAAIGFFDGKTGAYAGYPSRWRALDPSSWTTMEFSVVAVPEFSSLMVLLPVLALPLLLVRRQRRNTR